MDLIRDIFLAIIQGLTEFLPISSSAHLILPSQVLGWPDQGLAFDVAVHLGTLFAVVIYFRREIVELTTAWFASFGGQQTEHSKLAWWVILATIPAVVAGFLAKDFIENNLRAAWVIGVTTIVFGILLGVADRMGKLKYNEFQLGWQKALVIGLSQAIALIPGTSRSGITMTAALFLGLTREAAARFSFLMSIPIISGAALLLLKDLVETPQPVDWLGLGLGTAVAFVSAYACIYWFLKALNRIGMMPFVIYRLVLGVVLLAFFI